jgi:hypothetical protein
MCGTVDMSKDDEARRQMKLSQDAADKRAADAAAAVKAVGPAPTVTDPTPADTEARRRKQLDAWRAGMASTIKTSPLTPPTPAASVAPMVSASGVKTKLGQ